MLVPHINTTIDGLSPRRVRTNLGNSFGRQILSMPDFRHIFSNPARPWPLGMARLLTHHDIAPMFPQLTIESNSRLLSNMACDAGAFKVYKDRMLLPMSASVKLALNLRRTSQHCHPHTKGQFHTSLFVFNTIFNVPSASDMCSFTIITQECCECRDETGMTIQIDICQRKLDLIRAANRKCERDQILGQPCPEYEEMSEVTGSGLCETCSQIGKSG